MASLLGYIDTIKNCVLYGWATTISASHVSVYCNDILACNLDELHSRQDIVDTGYCGFRYDLSLCFDSAPQKIFLVEFK
jgi:hypothetical protein